MTATLPKLTEREFMDQVTQLAELRGWSWAHFRPAQTAKGWRTPVSGPLGKGWPDLVLVRERDARLIFAELKRDGVRLTPEQKQVRESLQSVVTYPHPKWEGTNHDPTVEVVCWRPHNWADIEDALR